MFDKSKVKAHNRLSKSKSGFKVIRVKDFFRKKSVLVNKKEENNSRRNEIIGATAIVGAAGIAYLIGKKNNIKFPGEINNKPLLIKRESPIKVINETIGTPPKQKPVSGEKFIEQLDEEWGISKKKPLYNKVEDPWDTPISYNIKKSTEQVIQETNSIKALPPAKTLNPRENLLVSDNRTARRVTKKAVSDAVRIDNMEKIYKSISPDNLAMKASIKIDHYLKRPRRTSNLGALPKPTSLEEVVSNPNIKQAQQKIEDRLSRAERYKLQKKARLAKKN